MSFIAVALGSLLLLATTICVFIYKTHHTGTKVIAGIMLLLLLIFFVLTVYKHYDSMHLYAVYLKWSTKMFLDRKLSIIYIPIFLILLTGFIFILVW